LRASTRHSALSSQDSSSPSFWELVIVWDLAFVLFVALAPRFLDYLKPPTGDEVFYLITTQSIVYDHDLDETNQFAGKAWLAYYPTCAEFRAPGWKGFAPAGIPCGPDSRLGPERTHTQRPGTYTKHGLGLSFLIAPAFAFGGRPVVVSFLNAIAALLGVNIFLLAWETSGRRRVAWLCWAALTFAAPIFSYAYLIFPQPVAALCVLYAFRRARHAAVARLAGGQAPPNNAWQLTAVGVCVGILPWLHNLYVVLAPILLAYLYLGGRREMRRRGAPVGGAAGAHTRTGLLGHMALLLIVGVFATLYVTRLLYLYGVPWPPPQDHHGFNGPLLFPVGFLGLLFDQKYGLLMYNPIYLVPMAWLARVACVRRALGSVVRSELTWLVAIIAPYYLIVSAYSRWWGEWCPPARYVLPIAPLLVLPLARALTLMRSRLLAGYCGVAVLWAGAISVAFVLNPILSYNWSDPKPCKVLLWLEDHNRFFHTIALGNFFPYYVNFIEPLTPVYYGAHVAWLIAAVWLGWHMMRCSPVTELTAWQSQVARSATG
jgi:hypothetical protein